MFEGLWSHQLYQLHNRLNLRLKPLENYMNHYLIEDRIKQVNSESGLLHELHKNQCRLNQRMHYIELTCENESWCLFQHSNQLMRAGWASSVYIYKPHTHTCYAQGHAQTCTWPLYHKHRSNKCHCPNKFKIQMKKQASNMYKSQELCSLH